MSPTYAAGVEGEEYGFLTSETRRGAIDDALEPLLEEVAAGNKEPGDWTVVVHTGPVWCEGEGCEEHEPEHDRCMVASAGWTDVHVEVYFAYPDDETIGPEWQYVGLIDELREAFPALVWERQSDTPGAALSGGMPKGAKYWSVVVEPDLSRWLLHGDFTNFGDDPIAELRDAITAEGREIAWRADRLTETARLLGGQPQSDWRAAVAEDSSSYMARELWEARRRIRELERQRDEHYRDNEEICEEDPREGCTCAGCHTRRERYRARVALDPVPLS